MFNILNRFKALFNPVVYVPITDDDQVKIIVLTRYRLTNGHHSFFINATSVDAALEQGKEYFDTPYWVEV